jgi:hypothetical protein
MVTGKSFIDICSTELPVAPVLPKRTSALHQLHRWPIRLIYTPTRPCQRRKRQLQHRDTLASSKQTPIQRQRQRGTKNDVSAYQYLARIHSYRWPHPPVINSESDVEEEGQITMDIKNSSGEFTTFQNYEYILTYSAGKVSTSLDDNAGYESGGDSNTNGGDEDYGREVRICLLLDRPRHLRSVMRMTFLLSNHPVLYRTYALPY